MPEPQLAFIGGGVMGEAIIRGVLDRKVTFPQCITVADVSASRLDYLRKTYGVNVTADNCEAMASAAFIVLAVKPQNLKDLFQNAAGKLRPDQTVVSIIAGASMHSLAFGLEHGDFAEPRNVSFSPLVRVMPNTPGQIGRGVSVWTATEAVTDEQRETVRSVLAALGHEIYVPDERYLDMATALSGSGPAYVFLFIEALIDAGVHIGMPRDMAEQLALHTVAGSAELAMQSGRHPAQLRNMVTSPGGTTTEGLLKLESGGLRTAVFHAVLAAYEKSVALGRISP